MSRQETRNIYGYSWPPALKDSSNPRILGGVSVLQRTRRRRRRVNFRDRRPGGATWQLALALGGGGKDGEGQRCMEGFYFGKAVQKNIQPNVAVKRETQILSVKKTFDQSTSSEEGRRPMPGGVTARQADGWPPAGKAISLSTVQGKIGRLVAGLEWQWLPPSQSCHRPPREAAQAPGTHAHPQLCQEHRTDPSGWRVRGAGEGIGVCLGLASDGG